MDEDGHADRRRRPSSLGREVALSADGATVLAGDSGFYSTQIRGVHAFRDSGGTWSSAGELSGPATTNGGFGAALALDADGARAVAGDYGPGEQQGKAFADTAAGSSWSAQELRSPESSPDDLYGNAVALDGSGGVAAIGAAAFGDRGAVVIFDGTTPHPPQTVHC